MVVYLFAMFGMGGQYLDPSNGLRKLVADAAARGINVMGSPYRYQQGQEIVTQIMQLPLGAKVAIGGASCGANTAPGLGQALEAHRRIDYMFGFQPSLWCGCNDKANAVPANVSKALCIWNGNMAMTGGLGYCKWTAGEHTAFELVDRRVMHPGDHDTAMQEKVLAELTRLLKGE
jgi:hypothetical protein